MLVQVYGDSAMKKTAVYEWVKRFEDGQQQAERKKTLQKFVNLWVKIVGWLSEA